MAFYVYVLKSQIFDRHYIGSCENLDVRLKRHNAGKVRSSKAYRPYQVIYSEAYDTRSQALKREKFFKTIDGYNFLKSIDIY